MSNKASFQWVCRSANPFAREVVAGIAPEDIPGGSLPGVAEINAVALSKCMRTIDALVRSSEPRSNDRPDDWGAVGRTLMIASPRAGYGKSHLVARIADATRGAISTLPIEFDPAEPLSWRSLFGNVLRLFGETVVAPAGKTASGTASGRTLWQETGRRFFAEAFLAAVAGTEGNEDDDIPQVDATGLRRNYARELAPGDSTSLREWILENSYHISETAGGPLRDRWQIDEQALASWTDAFRRSALDNADADELSAIFRSLLPAEGDRGEVLAKARLGELLRMAASCRPLALVIDHLDGFFGRPDTGMPLATIVSALRGMVRRGITLLCLNQDIWESVFEGQLPSALIDRLCGEPAALGTLKVEEALDLVRQRLNAGGIEADHRDAFVDLLVQREGWRKGAPAEAVAGLYSRAVLRRASAAWEWLVEREERGVRDVPGETQFPVASPPVPESTGDFDPPDTSSAYAAVSPGVQSPGHGRMTNLESIVAEIRSGGARAVSEGPSDRDLPPAPAAAGRQAHHGRHNGNNGQIAPTTNGHPVAERSAGRSPEQLAPAVRSPGPTGPPKAATPAPAVVASSAVVAGAGVAGPAAFAAAAGSTSTAAVPVATQSVAELSNPETDLRRRVAGYRSPGEALAWLPTKIERLVCEIGSRYPAVGQVHSMAGGQEYIRWTVRERAVLLGYHSIEDRGFWRRVMHRASKLEAMTSNKYGPRAVKVVAFAPASSQFDKETWLGEIDVRNAGLWLDSIVLHDDDLALLYAGDDMILEAGADEREDIIRFVGRRMDPFWRRLTRPLPR